MDYSDRIFFFLMENLPIMTPLTLLTRHNNIKALSKIKIFFRTSGLFIPGTIHYYNIFRKLFPQNNTYNTIRKLLPPGLFVPGTIHYHIISRKWFQQNDTYNITRKDLQYCWQKTHLQYCQEIIGTKHTYKFTRKWFAQNKLTILPGKNSHKKYLQYYHEIISKIILTILPGNNWHKTYLHYYQELIGANHTYNITRKWLSQSIVTILSGIDN